MERVMRRLSYHLFIYVHVCVSDLFKDMDKFSGSETLGQGEID